MEKVRVTFIKKERRNVRLYILCHNERRFTEAQAAFSGYSWAIPIRMKYQNCTFENAFWKQLLEIKEEWVNCEMVGTLSSIAHTKVDLRDIDRIIHTPALWTSGYYHFTSNEKPIINEHPHLLTILGDVCASLNLQIPKFSWCTYWMCTPALMERFIKWYEESLQPAVMAHPLAMTDAKYGRGKLTQVELMALCGTPYYPYAPFVIERLNKAFFDKQSQGDEYNTLATFSTLYSGDIKDPKVAFRYFCFRHLNYMRLFSIPEITQFSTKEAVLIEYRKFPHLEFLIRNMILKLGTDWMYTVLCGTANYEFIQSMCAAIHPNIRVVLTPYDNLTPSLYSSFLASADFWKMLHGEKILIYQEDSIIFKNNINDFLEWDYIGAPWPREQNDTPNGVGNGGFSLRTRAVMLDVISRISILDTRPSNSTIEYMTNTTSTILPEDVYFSKNIQELGLGKVAPWHVAFEFSTETQYNPNSLGGHNFWNNDSEWESRIYKSLFKFAHIRTPYGLNIGGGEKYLLDICNYFITKKHCIVVIEVNEDTTVALKTIRSVIGNTDSIILVPYESLFPFTFTPEYFVLMENSAYPSVKGGAAINVYHCQFPFSTNNERAVNLSSYHHIILNSEFTKSNYEAIVPIVEQAKISVLYPSCITSEVISFPKEENTFVVCGRIFDYNPNAHNKNFDKVIEAFNSSTNKTYTLHIIGACYSTKWLAYLQTISKTNVVFHIDCTDEEKQDVLQSAKFIINATGLGRDKKTAAFSYEHFGISMIEGLATGCIPITVNGGFPEYYVAKSKQPLIYDSIDSLSAMLSLLETTSSDHQFDSDYYSELLLSFNKEHHTTTLDSVFAKSNIVKRDMTLYNWENVFNMYKQCNSNAEFLKRYPTIGITTKPSINKNEIPESIDSLDELRHLYVYKKLVTIRPSCIESNFLCKYLFGFPIMDHLVSTPDTVDRYMTSNTGLYYSDLSRRTEVLDWWWRVTLDLIKHATYTSCYAWLNQDLCLLANMNLKRKLYNYSPLFKIILQHSEGLRILYIGNAVASIRAAYARGVKNVWRFPVSNFTLECIQTPQTTTGMDYPHDTMIETCELLQKEIQSIEFDTAILGCGAYGPPLTNFIRTTFPGKNAIYLGSDCFKIFGITVPSWKWEEDPHFNKDLIHDQLIHVVEPLPDGV